MQGKRFPGDKGGLAHGWRRARTAGDTESAGSLSRDNGFSPFSGENQLGWAATFRGYARNMFASNISR